MKPMIALIITGVILLLVMLYFGNKSFEGTFESNVYQNAPRYNKTAPIIKELEKQITNVELYYDNTSNTTTLKYNFNNIDKYSDSVINDVELTYSAKSGSVFMKPVEENGKLIYTYEGKLKQGLITIIFYVLADNITVKVLKSVYIE